jgi:hypothetical protein
MAAHHGLTAGVHPGYRDRDHPPAQAEQPSAQPASGRNQPAG